MNTPRRAYLQDHSKHQVNTLPYPITRNCYDIEATECFYTQMFKTWAKINYSDPNTFDDILRQPIWYNSLIHIGNKNVDYPHWCQAGVIKLKTPFLNNEGKIATQHILESKYNICIKELSLFFMV